MKLINGPTKTDDNVIQGRKCGDTIDSKWMHKELNEHYKHRFHLLYPIIG
jgi:hypothetical protein